MTHSRRQSSTVTLWAAALLFKVQIILINDVNRHNVLNPDISIRRIFLRLHNELSFSWLHQVKTPCMANLCYDEVTNAPITVNVCIAADLEFKADIARLPSTTSQQLEWSHQAHNGLTGHPGVHPLTATIYGLKQNGH